MDDLLNAASAAFDQQREMLFSKSSCDDAAFLWVVHDVHDQRVKGYVQAKNWFQSLTSAQ